MKGKAASIILLKSDPSLQHKHYPQTNPKECECRASQDALENGARETHGQKIVTQVTAGPPTDTRLEASTTSEGW